MKNISELFLWLAFLFVSIPSKEGLNKNKKKFLLAKKESRCDSFCFFPSHSTFHKIKKTHFSFFLPELEFFV